MKQNRYSALWLNYQAWDASGAGAVAAADGTAAVGAASPGSENNATGAATPGAKNSAAGAAAPLGSGSASGAGPQPGPGTRPQARPRIVALSLPGSGGLYESIRSELERFSGQLVPADPAGAGAGPAGSRSAAAGAGGSDRIGEAAGDKNPPLWELSFQLLESGTSAPGLPSRQDQGFMIERGREQNPAPGTESFLIRSASREGLLYGCFSLIRRWRTGELPAAGDRVSETPALEWRMLNHWDNLDRSVERGYAGKSIWQWDDLPGRLDGRYRDYARLCASAGINAVSVNNVNDAQRILEPGYLSKVAALAGVFRDYGIRTFVSVNFASPMILGGLSTADPLDADVIVWWESCSRDIYGLIPDFGGFLVKADSEGQPGPFAYGRSHAEGANMLARALRPWGGLLVWRAFVYGHGESDRARTAYEGFAPFDGQFEDNVAIQVKNGAIDFQPREPVHPLFYGIRKSSIFMEFQVTQEYLGQGNHVVYLGPMWKEILDFSFTPGDDSGRVARLLQGPGDAGDSTASDSDTGAGSGRRASGIAAVANIGDDADWCGSPMHALNWYAYGRLAWDPDASAEKIADEWLRCSFGDDPDFLGNALRMLAMSWETCIDYMTPLGLHHIMQEGHHYGPDPGFDGGPREDWRSTYYHRADSRGLGFDRTLKGSRGVEQYPSPWKEIFNDLDRCPEKYLLWFHHVSWDHRTSSGRLLMDEIDHRYARGVAGVEHMISLWEALESRIDDKLYTAVRNKLEIQLMDAREWQQVCVPYFRSFVPKPFSS